MRKDPHVRICGGLGSATTLVYPTGTLRTHLPHILAFIDRSLTRSSLSSESSFPIGFGRMRTNGRGGPVYTLMSRSRSRACCCLALGVVALWKVGASGPALGRRHVLRMISPR